MTETEKATQIIAETRAAFVQSLHDCIQIRHQPLRVVLWASDGTAATRLEYPASDAEAKEFRTTEIARLTADWDEEMADCARYENRRAAAIAAEPWLYQHSQD